MSKHFITSLFLMVLLNVLIKPLWIFGIDRQVQVVLGVEVYGKYFALLSLAFIFNIFLDVGMTQYTNRTIAAGVMPVSTIMANALLAKLLLSLLYTLFILLLTRISGISSSPLLLLIILLQILTSLLLFMRGIVSGLQLFKTDSILSVIDKALMIVVAGVWLYTPRFRQAFTIEDFALLQVITIAVTLFLALFILAKKNVFQHWQIQTSYLFKVLQQSAPFALTIFFMSIHNRADAFLLERIHPHGAYEAGVYAAAYRVLDAANMVGYLFATILISYWARHNGDKRSINESLTLSHQLLIPAGLLVALLGFFLHQPLFQVLYHHTNRYADEIFKWCLLTIVPYFITHLYGTLLTASGQIKSFMWLVLFSVLINLSLNLILIPVYGAAACVTAGLFSQTFLALMTMLLVKKQLQQTVRWHLWIRYGLMIGLLGGLLWWLNTTALHWWFILLITLIAWFVWMNVLRIFSVRSFLRLMNEK